MTGDLERANLLLESRLRVQLRRAPTDHHATGLNRKDGGEAGKEFIQSAILRRTGRAGSSWWTQGFQKNKGREVKTGLVEQG